MDCGLPLRREGGHENEPVWPGFERKRYDFSMETNQGVAFA